MSDRLKTHLIGRNEPVFETLFNQFHDPTMAALNITASMNSRLDCETSSILVAPRLLDEIYLKRYGFNETS